MCGNINYLGTKWRSISTAMTSVMCPTHSTRRWYYYNGSEWKADLKSQIHFYCQENFGKGSGVKPDRQMESHPHGAWTYGPFVYVADLGSDKIWHYIVSSTLYLLLFLSSSLDPIYYLLKRFISTAAKKICRVLI